MGIFTFLRCPGVCGIKKEKEEGNASGFESGKDGEKNYLVDDLRECNTNFARYGHKDPFIDHLLIGM
ncbi:hypothetical protein Ccrd_024363 [Cynara cardunculus var. scolymus]|uniref:Uncharacterized protein n=1 Tax=Cynara cardunculus var. scolymus TaxID=59895 RepID=A0A103XCJ4_CYNCS|nr:hypothetical protein Ccrd_024363 [Cynara cardunculus var. scolymus]